MFQFINWLKVLASVCITNSHYAHVWPTPALAFGGHLGNNLFFLISGFCLSNINERFPKWYLKRIIRIYPAVWITNIIYIAYGYFKVHSFSDFFRFFIYPTGFHFIGSIMLLYIVLYIVNWMKKRYGIKIWWVMLFVAVVFVLFYIFKFDKTYYHIDKASEKWVLFMFTESMLVGYSLRDKISIISKKISIMNWIGVICSLGLYFAGKKVFTNISTLSSVQFLQPVIVVFMVSCIAVLFIKLEKKGVLKLRKEDKLISVLSGLTLEIYLSQDLVVTIFKNMKFPFSFFAVTGGILLYAYLVHFCTTFIKKNAIKCYKIIKNKT